MRPFPPSRLVTVTLVAGATLVASLPLRAEFRTPIVVDGIATNTGGDLQLGGTHPAPAMLIRNRGTVVSAGRVRLGFSTTSGDHILLSDPGSSWTSTNEVVIGWDSSGNSLVVSNGACLSTRQTSLGIAGKNNTITITGPESTWTNRNAIHVGRGRRGEENTLCITRGARVQSGTVRVGMDSGRSRLVIADGGRLTCQGNFSIGATPSSRENTVRVEGEGSLLEISRPGGILIGQTGEFADPTEHLEIAVGGSMATPLLVVANTGTLLASNTVSMVRAGTVTNMGAILTTGSEVAWLGQQVFLGGRFTGHTSTNRFSGSVHVLPGGTWTLPGGGLLDFGKNLRIESTNNPSGLAASVLRFSGGVEHEIGIAGPDHGPDGTKACLAFGAVSLGSAADVLSFTGLSPGGTNAVYVGDLDLLGDLNLVANLRAPPSVRIYYNPTHRSPTNLYLKNATYPLKGGGLLLPGAVPPAR